MDMVDACGRAGSRAPGTIDDAELERRVDIWIAAMWRAAFVILWMTAGALWLTVGIGRLS